MKTHIVIIIFILAIALIFLSCQKDYSSIESMIKLDGKWIHKQYAPGWNDTLLTIYHFMNDSQFEEGIAEVRHTHYNDTIYHGGIYQIPIPRLLFVSYNYYRRGDTINIPISGSDTLVFWKNYITLELSPNGRSFKQLSGRSNQLIDSKFYDALLLGDKYSHDMLYFSEDSLTRYSYTSQSTQPPSDWPETAKYKIEITDRYINTKTNSGTVIKRSYLFYNGRLILTESPINYYKIN